jgi:hypothetical protein
VVDTMYRMKMYFEDAGKRAFMKNMGCPIRSRTRSPRRSARPSPLADRGHQRPAGVAGPRLVPAARRA